MPVIVITSDELEQLLRQVVAEEVKAAVTGEITQFLSTPEENRLLTRKEAMEQLSIKSRDTMIRMEKAGELPPVHIGNRVHYHLVDIQKLKRRGA